MLDTLAAGQTVDEAISSAITPDEGRELRQLHVIDASGRSARHTGASCVEWCGHLGGESFSVAGNMLAGEDVIHATATFYREHADLPFAELLVESLAAGEAAGGDKRGKQAAALLIHTTEDYPAIDIRVDDHADPIPELRRLLEASYDRFQPFTAYLATRAHPSGTIDLHAVEEGIRQFHEARRDASQRERTQT